MSDRGLERWSSGSAYDAYIGRWSRLAAIQFMDWLAITPGRRWLDVGCGTGALSEAILARFGPSSVVGVDPSDAFVEQARATVRDPRASFDVGTAATTGLADAAVDVVVSGLVLQYVPNLGEALSEARRVVRPGGVVAGYVWDYAEGMQFIRQFWAAAVAIDPAAERFDQAVRFAHTERGPLAAAFTAAGLEAVEVRSIDIPTVFVDFDDLWMPFLGGVGGAPGYVVTLDESERDAIRERYRASVDAEPDGTIRMTARAWAVRGRRPG